MTETSEDPSKGHRTPDKLRSFVDTELSGPLVELLANCDRRYCIVSPRWLRDLVIGAQEDCSAVWLSLESRDFSRCDGRVVVVVAGERAEEARLAAAIRERRPTTVLTFLEDVFPFLVTQLKRLGEHTPCEQKYAILSIPRTGTTYLCALLTDRGLGNPAEHIRHPAARLIEGDPTEFTAIMRAFERCASVNRVFGTKLIAHFLLETSHWRIDLSTIMVRSLKERGYQLFRLRRNFLDCVVSGLIAGEIGVWHVYDARDKPSDLVASRRTDRELIDLFANMAVQSIALDLAADGLDVVEIDYDELVGDPLGVVGRFQERLVVRDSTEHAPTRFPVPTRQQVGGYDSETARLTSLVRDHRDALTRRIRGGVLATVDQGARARALELIGLAFPAFGLGGDNPPEAVAGGGNPQA